jgi:hypothetical protein
MVEAFERIEIEVADLAAASSDCIALFGVRPAPAPVPGEAWLALANTTIALREAPVAAARISGLVLRDPQVIGSVDNPLGLVLTCSDGTEGRAFRDGAEAHCTSVAVDHLVLRTDRADACIALFRDRLGIRLALDQTVEAWGGRMLFFRTGKMTLEVIEGADNDGNCFWGIAYQHPDLDAWHGELVARGVTCSDIRDGRKRGTRVATVKSHSLGLPTLLVEPAVR